MKKLVSVIIPAYNHQQYIKECIESVIQQTYKNLEIIIQDDCSTDDTVKEIKKINDKRIRVILSKKNQGVVDTLNDLIKLCNGDYIAIIGSDDIWYPTKIEKQVNILERNSNIGCVFTDVDIIDENGLLYSNDDYESPINIFCNVNMKLEERIKLFYDCGNHLCHSSSLMPKKIVEEIGKYNRAYRQLHDYDYWSRLIVKYDIYIIEEKLMGYRWSRNNKTSISSSINKNIIRTINESYCINYNLIMGMDDELFIRTFKSEFVNKNSKTKEEISCEKYFILLKLKCGTSINKHFALSFIFNYSDNDKLFTILKEKFNYTLNDFYEDTGLISEVYPVIYNDKYNNIINNNQCLQHEINELVNSSSWKITKPLRFISCLLKKRGRDKFVK